MEEYGYKYKISNLQAAMGCAQIERAHDLIGKKRLVFSWYKEFLKDIPCRLNPEPSGTKNSYWMPTAVFDSLVRFDREALFAYMKDHNIDSRPFFYPLSSLPMFVSKPENQVSYALYSRGINMPSHYDLSREDVEFVCKVIKSYFDAD